MPKKAKRPSAKVLNRVRRKALKVLEKRRVPAKRLDDKTPKSLRGRRTAKRK